MDKEYFEEPLNDKCEGCNEKPVVGKRWSELSKMYWLVCKSCMESEEWDIEYD